MYVWIEWATDIYYNRNSFYISQQRRLQFYIPEVQAVEQVKDEADKMVEKEFDKLETKIQSKDKWMKQEKNKK